ncbi:nuclear transport factor 2 family protein [Planomonospora corallina]|uniref:Nuclear transport factor 2 family protein n=1 Tax=Planomonospora corallina TaxID=1806052 RepID=A0ABV8IEJ5_9ACTN
MRDFYEALAKNDLGRIRDHLLADDAVFHVPGGGSLSGDYRGKEQVIGYLERFAGPAESLTRFEPEEFLTGERHVAVLLRVQGERGGRRLDERGLHVFRVEDGKITERLSYPQDPRGVDEFFA